MYTKFHDRTSITQFIQQTLADSYFPIEKTIFYGDIVVKDITYILEDNIVKAISSGLLTEDNFSERLRILEPYSFGNNYPGLTLKYTSNSSEYDSSTHYYLGQYLRAIRDLKQIDLMPFYNCFNDEYVQGISFTQTGIQLYQDSRFKFLSVPIKFGKQYSISIDFFGTVQLQCAFIGRKGLLADETKSLQNMFTGTRTATTYCQMSHPYLFNGVMLDDIIESADSTTLSNLVNKEKLLRLVIQLPANCTSSVAVLEGDYTKTNGLYLNQTNKVPYQVVIGNLLNQNLTGQDIVYINNNLISQLSLIKMSDDINYPFADRLLEYLCYNVITSQDSIDNNIQRVQETVSSFQQKKVNGTSYDAKYTPGVWDENLRNYLYTFAINSPIIKSKYDLTGFVDKDVEQLINRGN